MDKIEVWIEIRFRVCLLLTHSWSKAMKEIVITLAKALVDRPEFVSVNEIDGFSTMILELSVDKQDIGKIIGKQGRTITAMRTILNAASAKEKKRTLLELMDGEIHFGVEQRGPQ
jgi:uncharacterized protein